MESAADTAKQNCPWCSRSFMCVRGPLESSGHLTIVVNEKQQPCDTVLRSTVPQEARNIAMRQAEEDLDEAERRFSEERDRLLEHAEAAAAVAATQVQTIEELKTMEAGARREFEKARQERRD